MSIGNPADLWPDDLQVEEFVAPEEIMEEQASFFTDRMGGLLVASIQKTTATDRVKFTFTVHAANIEAHYKLFSVMHRLELAYPAAIDPPDIQLPNYLKEKYYQPGVIDGGFMVNQLVVGDIMRGKTVENPYWIAATPKEFRDRIKVIIQSSEVRSIIVSLMAQAQKDKNTDTKKAS